MTAMFKNPPSSVCCYYDRLINQLQIFSIPVTPAGKLDKNRLPPIGSSGTEEGSLPSTPTEHGLAKLWCELLNLPNIDVQEGFFDLGG